MTTPKKKAPAKAQKNPAAVSLGKRAKGKPKKRTAAGLRQRQNASLAAKAKREAKESEPILTPGVHLLPLSRRNLEAMPAKAKRLAQEDRHFQLPPGPVVDAGWPDDEDE